jgi:hypothetical protein
VNYAFLVSAGVFLCYVMARVINFPRCECVIFIYGNVRGFWNAPFSANILISTEYSGFAENICQV